MNTILRASLSLAPMLATGVAAQTVLPPYSGAYSAIDLGTVPGRSDYGGIAIRPDAPDVLLYGQFGGGRIVAVPLVRDGQGRIVGFGAPATTATVSGPDGGLAVGPGGVLFATAWGAHLLDQLRPGSTRPDRTLALDALGVPRSVGTCAFAPPGHPAAGRLKLLSFDAATWTDATLAPDGNGTWSVVAVGSPIALAGGPEAVLYPPTGLPLLPDDACVLIGEWSTGELVRYDTDTNGDPLPATRQPVLANAPGIAGGAVDPATGDLLFSFGAGHLLALRSVATPCGTFTSFGAASGGGHATLSGSGCARLGQRITLRVTGGRPHAPGVLNVGLGAVDLPVLGLRVRTLPVVAVGHALDESGELALQLTLPADPVLTSTDVCMQALHADPAGASGWTATAGLRMRVR